MQLDVIRLPNLLNGTCRNPFSDNTRLSKNSSKTNLPFDAHLLLDGLRGRVEYLFEVGSGSSRRNTGHTAGSQDDGYRKVYGFPVKIHAGQQGKHIPGHNNYIRGRGIIFPEGDSYICNDSTGDEDDNGDEYEVGEEGYEDWPALDFFNIVQIVKDSPNRGQCDNGIVISRQQMPSDVTSDGHLLYSAEKGLFLDHGRILDAPRTGL